MKKALLAAFLAALPATVALATPSDASDLVVEPFTMPQECRLAADWWANVVATNPPGSWVPLNLVPTDGQLDAMGLPPAAVLAGMRFPNPTMVTREGQEIPVPREAVTPTNHGPTVATYGGTGCLGIRPGALLLNMNGGGISLCSFAHVYGSPGNYQISTAGHCTTKVGERITVVAGVGNQDGVLHPILLDIGKTAKTTGDGGVGKDWALVGIDAPNQALVTPTACVWGGPRGGAFAEEGSLVYASVYVSPRVRFTYSYDPDAALVQGIVHYGHGLGVGAGGTPRVGSAFRWTPTWFEFEGAIAPGDSGSFANVATGQAAGIVTHLLVPAFQGNGPDTAAGTRATIVPATLAAGQIVAYPVPLQGAP